MREFRGFSAMAFLALPIEIYGIIFRYLKLYDIVILCQLNRFSSGSFPAIGNQILIDASIGQFDATFENSEDIYWLNTIIRKKRLQQLVEMVDHALSSKERLPFLPRSCAIYKKILSSNTKTICKEICTKMLFQISLPYNRSYNKQPKTVATHHLISQLAFYGTCFKDVTSKRITEYIAEYIDSNFNQDLHNLHKKSSFQYITYDMLLRSGDSELHINGMTDSISSTTSSNTISSTLRSNNKNKGRSKTTTTNPKNVYLIVFDEEIEDIKSMAPAIKSNYNVVIDIGSYWMDHWDHHPGGDYDYYESSDEDEEIDNISDYKGMIDGDGILKLSCCTRLFENFNADRELIFTNITRNLRILGHGFLRMCRELSVVDLSSLIDIHTIESNFMMCCDNLKELRLPKGTINHCGSHFLSGCKSLKSIDLSPLCNLTELADYFLWCCLELEHIDMSVLCNIKRIGTDCIRRCVKITHINLHSLSMLNIIGDNFLLNCTSLVELDLSGGLISLETIGEGYLHECNENVRIIKGW